MNCGFDKGLVRTSAIISCVGVYSRLMTLLKALLHCATFSATCFAMVENLALQVCRGLELRPYYTVQFSQQLVSQCSSERKTRSVRMRPCLNCRKIARQVAGGVIHCEMVLSIAAIRCEK